MKSVRLGQHFLVNENVLRKLLASLPFPPPNRVLEIGTGDGRLTEKLLEAGYEVTSYELDEALYEKAKRRLAGNDKLRLILGDGFTDQREYDVLVSSLPFYASRRFVEWFSSSSIPIGVIILQKEFVDKITSKPGDPKYGAYSVLASYCFMMEELFIVSPYDFEPRPRVFSSVLRMKRLRTLPNARRLVIRLKSLFGYRGRLVASFIRDLKKKRLLDKPVVLSEGLLDRRVEDLIADEALDLIREVISE
jgi:16S rRNA (adenine1518-N6/adenine1519-N6)-dimethyltransferase